MGLFLAVRLARRKWQSSDAVFGDVSKEVEKSVYNKLYQHFEFYKCERIDLLQLLSTNLYK